MARSFRRLVARSPRFVGAAAVALVLAACGGGDGEDGAPTSPRPTGAQADDPVLMRGRRVFIESCARCHGARGEGASAPRLAGRVEDVYPDVDDQETVVREGRGLMPSFADDLSDADIEAVVRYEREVL